MTSSDPIRTYQETVRRRESAEAEAQRLADTIHNASSLLRDWREVRIVGMEFPIAVSRTNSIDPKKWPTIEALGQALKAWHDSDQASRNAWAAIPRADRKKLRDPGS